MLQPGDLFGDYRVLKLLGKGGIGSVFLLENAGGGQVAAKILDPESAGDHEARKRFLREAQLALGVKHPNLVETYDVGEDPDTGLCYILMEYVSGGSLADYLKANGALPVEDAVAVVQAMASVLELARQKGIVHRDIKPGNIMFDAEGTPKLADLGIARGGIAGTETTTVTQTGMVIGTPAYMAPEQMLDAHKVDTRADIYSLGVVFFEMLTGERPNKDDTVVQLMAKAVKGEPLPDVRTLRPEVSASVAELISLMCAMKADERVQTPAEVTTALSQIEHGHEVTIVRKRPGVVSRKSAKSDGDSSRSVVATLLGCVVVAGIAMFVYFGPRERSSADSPSTQSVDARTSPPVVTKTNVVEKVVERIVEKKVESKATALDTLASHPESGKSQDWQSGPDGKWFVSWDEALVDARDRKRPILVLNTGSTWCHWCKKLRTEVLDHDVFKEFADAHLTLLYLDSPCENVDQRNHNKLIVKALKFSGGVPNVQVFTGTGMLLGSVGGGGLAADAYIGKLRDILSKGGEDKLDADGRILFTDGYAALAAKIAEARAKLPKVAKSDFKAKLVGVAVVDGDNRSRWNLNAEFLPPETHIEVPFGKTALFKVEYDFPEGYEARVWARDEWTGEQRRNSSFFGSNPSGLYKGKGVTTGFLSLLARGKTCSLKSLAIRTSSEPEIDDRTREWRIGSFPVDVVFREKDAETENGETTASVDCALPPRQGDFDWLEHPPSAEARPLRVRIYSWPKQIDNGEVDWAKGYFTGLDMDVQTHVMPNVNVRSLRTENMDLAFFWSRYLSDRYSDDEVKAIERYLNEGGNVVVVSYQPGGAQDRLLNHFGLKVKKLATRLESVAVCPGLKGLPVPQKAMGRGHPMGEEGESSWRSMIVRRDKANGFPVMAMRRVGRGRLFFLSSGLAGDSRNDRKWWRTFLRACYVTSADSTPVALLDGQSLKDTDPRRRVQKALDAIFPGWKLTSDVLDAETLGYAPERFGRRNVICTHTKDWATPMVLSWTGHLIRKDPVLNVSVASWDGGQDVDFRFQVRIDGKTILFDREIRGEGFKDYCFDLSRWAGRKVRIEVIQRENDWFFEMAWWAKLEVSAWDGKTERIADWRIEAPYLDHRQFEGPPPVRVQKTLDALFPGWKVSGTQTDHGWVGYRERYRNEDNLLVTHPVSGEIPCVLSRRVKLAKERPGLHLRVSAYGGCDAGLKVLVNGKAVDDRIVKGEGFQDLDIDLSAWAGKSVKLELVQYANDWCHEVIIWKKIFVE